MDLLELAVAASPQGVVSASREWLTTRSAK
jgi:hypothetical protein